jgi:hypothetical protein
MLTSSFGGRIACLGVMLFFTVVAGCGPRDGKLPVSGVVLCDGAPLPQAMIAFVGNAGGTIATASTDKDGKFSLRARPGVNQISVSAFDLSKADEWADIPEELTVMGDAEQQAEAMKNMPKPLVAQRFFNSSTSGLEVTVEEGMAEVTLEVTAKE